MPFEGLLSKLGTSAARELGPHLPRIVAGIMDRFRKDTGAMRASISAEIASLGAAHSSLASSLAQQADAMDLWQGHLIEIERKLDSVLENQRGISEQIASEEKQVRALRSLCIAVVVLLAGLLCAVAGLYFTHK